MDAFEQGLDVEPSAPQRFPARWPVPFASQIAAKAGNGVPTLLRGRPPLARPQRARSGLQAAQGSAELSLAVARAAPLPGPAAPASGATPRRFAPVAARRDSPF